MIHHILSALLAAAAFTVAADGQLFDDEHWLREELHHLNMEIEQLRSLERAHARYLIMVSDPELASLAALQLARNLQREDRINLLNHILNENEHSLAVRNGAYLMLIEDLQADGKMQESARMLEQMISENAEAVNPDSIQPVLQRFGPGERVEPERYGEHGHGTGYDIWPRQGGYYGDPTGQRLQHELRSPLIYRGHPDEYFQYDPFRRMHRWPYYRDPFDRPWWDNPRWHPDWWR